MDQQQHIPVIDISPFTTSGSDKKKPGVAADLAAACEHTGFFCVTGHGIDESLIAETRQCGSRFFSMPDESKRRLLRAASRTGRGYYPVADRALAKTLGDETPADLQEAWVMTREDVPDDPYFQTETAAYFFGPNLWPEDVPGFRETVLRYYDAVSGLAQQVMGALAMALGLEEHYFVDKFDKATNQFRIIHYPPQQISPEPGQLRAGAHTDYGAVTILRGDNVPGTLQIKLPEASWTDIRPPPGAFVCNLGDAMARWTGGRWASTLHRVGNPPVPLPEGRMTLVFFHQPNYDTLLSGINHTPDEPVTLAEHYIRKIHAAVDSVTPAA